jgi:hypothetical protein
MYAFRSYGTSIITSPDLMEIEHDNILGTKAVSLARSDLFRYLISEEFASVSSWKEKYATWLCLTWLWTVNFGL